MCYEVCLVFNLRTEPIHVKQFSILVRFSLCIFFLLTIQYNFGCGFIYLFFTDVIITYLPLNPFTVNNICITAGCCFLISLPLCIFIYIKTNSQILIHRTYLVTQVHETVFFGGRENYSSSIA